MRRHLRWLAAAVALVSLAALVSCAVGPNYHPQPPLAVAGYGVPATGRVPSATNAGVEYVDVAEVPVAWWTVFGASPLDDLVSEALRRSPTLAAAQAQLRQSEDARRAGYGLYMPLLAADASGARQRSAPLRLGSQQAGSIFSVFTLTGSVGYTIDVFGGRRRRVEVLNAQADEARENARATYLTLTASVVQAAISRAAYAAQANSTRTLIEAIQNQVRLTDVRYRAGTISYSDVVALQAQAAALEATLPSLALREEQAGLLLSVLCGHAPSEWQAPLIELSDYRMPSPMPVTLPSTLAKQRPDVRAAEARLHQSSANIGVATADLFPTVTLTKSLGSASGGLSGLGDSVGRFWSVGGDASMPIFAGGALWYTRRAAQEAYQASLQEYRAVVLAGLDQVASSLRALDLDSQALAAANRSVTAANASRQLAEAAYQAGVSDYLAVLVAVRGEQTAQLFYLQSVAQRLQDAVALFVALGGDWKAAPRDRVEGISSAITP